MFTINDETWYIRFVPSYHPMLFRSDGIASVGVCDDKKKIIYIDENLYGDFLKKVMCHEIVHAAMFSYNVDLNIDQEEILCDIIATYGEEIINITNYLFARIEGRI